MQTHLARIVAIVVFTIFSLLGLLEGRVVMANAEETSPIIIAHRGASALYPEHTLAGYQKAIEMGADFIEPDLVISKDGVLIARHDIYLSTTTDVAQHPEFEERKRFVAQLGRRDWLVFDFTLAELKTLRAVQAREGRDKRHDGKYEIPTLAEIIDLAKTHNEKTGDNVGIYPETKQPAIHEDMGYDFATLLLATLKDGGIAHGEVPLYIQSFEVDILLKLAPLTEIPLIYLLDEQDQDDLIEELRGYAGILAGIGPDKVMLRGDDGMPSPLMLAAQQLGLKTHPWTFRDDDIGEGFATAEEEYLAYFRLGIDGMFSDFSDTAVRLRAIYLNEKVSD